MTYQFQLKEGLFNRDADLATEFVDTEWLSEASTSLPGIAGNMFSVLPTGASGPFKNWVWPIPVWNGRKPVISNGFDPRPHPKWGMKHAGVDIFYLRLLNEPAKLPQGYKRWFVPSNLIPVYAAGDGIVVASGHNSSQGYSLGHYVIINHRNGYHTFYQHLTANGLPAKSTPVTAGTPIGIVGHGQRTRLNHLHFEIWPGGSKKRAVDPEAILRGMTSKVNGSAPAPKRPTAIPQVVTEALRNRRWADAIRLSIKSGERDENHLTNMVFFARHEERNGRKLVKSEPNFNALVKEWLTIRDSLVRPSLSGSSTPVTLPTTQKPVSVQTNDIPHGRYGKLVVESPNQYRFRYTFTPEDTLWLARLIKGEAGGRNDIDNQAVIWAVFNRFALFTHAGSYWMKRAGLRGYPTFSSFIQSYSTTLQPVLRSVGAAKRAINLSEKDPRRFQYIKTGGVYPGTTIPKGQLKHHLDRIQKMTWKVLPQETRNLVERAIIGTLPNPISLASEFANTKAYFVQNKKRSPRDYEEWRKYTETFARYKKWSWIGPIRGLDQMRKNAFFLDNRVKNLAQGTVRVVPSG